VAAVALGLGCGIASDAARAGALFALILSTAYLGYGYALNESLKARVSGALTRGGLSTATPADVQAYPTLLQLYLRRVVVRQDGEVRVGWVSTWRKDEPGRWESFDVRSDPRIEAARATPEGRILEWFAAGQTGGRGVDGGAAVEIDDLRYGIPGRPRDGLWGIRVPLDAQGRPSGPVTRFDRPLPDAPGRLLLSIFRDALFN
jgi:hypothetical protein